MRLKVVFLCFQTQYVTRAPPLELKICAKKEDNTLVNDPFKVEFSLLEWL